ncbi:hypothetical protein LBMAG03_13620 [Actinomycetes bacterium]|nr:hypothetical protein LBMAG03_13620 [Actinomycetes bacterium]
MSDIPTEEVPARELYTAQELADLALEWGASATIADETGMVVIDLDRVDSSIQLDLGPPSEFYEEMLCRGWVFVPNAPHRFCDRWNEFPHFGTYSVVYDENDLPMRSEVGFAIRVVKVIEFAKYRKQHDIVLAIIMFWYAIELVKEGLAHGETEISQLRERFLDGGPTAWWFGDS